MRIETTSEFLARGGKIKKVPAGTGTKYPVTGKRGGALKKRLAAEADTDYIARRKGASK